MKKTLILCILSAVLAAGITHWITELNKIQVEERKLISKPIELEQASLMTKAFRESSDFKIPVSWLFDGGDFRTVLGVLNGYPKFMRLYPGLEFDSTDKSYRMTLIAVCCRDKDTSDIVSYPLSSSSAIHEFADPCPPKCGTSNKSLLPHDEFKHHHVKKTKIEPCKDCD